MSVVQANKMMCGIDSCWLIILEHGYKITALINYGMYVLYRTVGIPQTGRTYDNVIQGYSCVYQLWDQSIKPMMTAAFVGGYDHPGISM